MKKLIYILILAAVTIGATSCVKNGDFDTGTQEATIVLKLQTPNYYGPGTRAMAAAKEDEIGELKVLVFSVNGATEKFTDILDAKIDVAGATTTAEFTVVQSHLGVTATKFVVLANCADILSAPGGLGIYTQGIMTNPHASPFDYDKVVGLITNSFAGAYSTTSAIPMWGEITENTLTNTNIAGGITATEVLLTRALARIDVGIGTPTEATAGDYSTTTWNGLKVDGVTNVPFQLSGVYVYRTNDSLAVVPTAANWAATLPTIPAGTDTLTTMSFTSVVSNQYITREIYVPEADVLMGATAATAFEDVHHVERMAIVVKGKWDSDGDNGFADNNTGTGGYDDSVDRYYRIDFKVQSTDNLQNVIRNHIYRFNIKDVIGPGAATADDAYNSNKADIVVNVEDWTLDPIDKDL